MAQPRQERDVDPQTKFKSGVDTFALLFTRWMDTNGWSHPTMVTLAKACLDGTGWLHSSQISGLRHARLLSPGPRTFIAIERLNFYIHRYVTTKKLLPGTPGSNLYAKAFAITEDGKPPELGWWVEVFCGSRIPKDIDLRQSFFTENQASKISATWGGMIRKLMIQKDMDIIVELDRVLREHYPAKDAEHLMHVAKDIQKKETWNHQELMNELHAISNLTSQLRCHTSVYAPPPAPQNPLARPGGPTVGPWRAVGPLPPARLRGRRERP